MVAWVTSSYRPGGRPETYASICDPNRKPKPVWDEPTGPKDVHCDLWTPVWKTKRISKARKPRPYKTMNYTVTARQMKDARSHKSAAKPRSNARRLTPARTRAGLNKTFNVEEMSIDDIEEFLMDAIDVDTLPVYGESMGHAGSRTDTDRDWRMAALKEILRLRIRESNDGIRPFVPRFQNRKKKNFEF